MKKVMFALTAMVMGLSTSAFAGDASSGANNPPPPPTIVRPGGIRI